MFFSETGIWRGTSGALGRVLGRNSDIFAGRWEEEGDV